MYVYVFVDVLLEWIQFYGRMMCFSETDPSFHKRDNFTWTLVLTYVL